MAAYATKEELAGDTGYLDQVDPSDANNETLLNNILLNATSIIDYYLGKKHDVNYFAAWGSASNKTLRGNGRSHFVVPNHQIGSVSSVTLNGSNVDHWEETELGVLHRITESGGVLKWTKERYVVNAIWGNGPLPSVVKEVVLELSVNIWRSRSKGGFSELLGAQGQGVIRFTSLLTKQQEAILKAVVRNHNKAGLV